MGFSPFEDEFDQEKAVRGKLEEILDILHDNKVDENTLISVTLPAILWFDTMQACSVAGAILSQAYNSIEDGEDKEHFLNSVEKTQTVYNEIWDSLIRVSKQEVK